MSSYLSAVVSVLHMNIKTTILGLLKNMNEKLTLTLIAIDEAHCISTWGHDFRFQYRELGKLKTLLPNVPFLAVTATATHQVRSDIISSLKLRSVLHYIMLFLVYFICLF